MNLSYQQTQSRLQAALTDLDVSLRPQPGDGWLYVSDVWPDKVVYQSFDGKQYERTYSIGDDGAAIFGDRAEVVAQTIYIPVPGETVAAGFAFSAGDDLKGRSRFTGMLFEEGDYGAKGNYDAAKIDALVASFPQDGVVVKDTHTSTFLGKCMEDDQTKVLRVWGHDAVKNGVTRRQIHGEVDAPNWLAHAARNATKKVSVGLTPDREKIREVSLVLKPHVEQAALFDREVAVAFSHSAIYPAFAAAHPDDAAFVTQAVEAHDPAPPPARAKRNETMNFREKTQAAFALLTPAQRETVGLTQAEIDDAANFAAPTPDARDGVMLRSAGKAELSALKAAGHPVPDEPFLALFSLAATEDGGGAVTFEKGEIKTGDAVKSLKTLVEAIPKKALGRESLPAAEFKTDDDKQADDKFTAAAKDAAAVKN